MPRTVAEVRLQDRSARGRLPARHHPYWRSICEGRHLGYYRGGRAGSWIARCRPPNSSEYVTKALGSADDVVEADGEAILSWRQALDAALAWFERVENLSVVEAADLTVQTAVEEYAAMRDARDSAKAGRPLRSDGRSRLTRYVVVDERLSRINLHELGCHPNEARLRPFPAGSGTRCPPGRAEAVIECEPMQLSAPCPASPSTDCAAPAR
jgi:hypothetical protein